MVRPEFGGSICTGVQRQYVAVGVCIVETSHERCQTGLVVVRISAFPQTECACLKIIIPEFVGAEIAYCCIISRVGFFLKFVKCQHVKEMFFPVFLIGQHHVAQQGFSLFGSFVSLAVRPDGGGEVLRIFHDIIGIGAEEV